MIRPTGAKYELAEKQRAISCGGIGMIMLINEAAPVFKLHLPYDEADGTMIETYGEKGDGRIICISPHPEKIGGPDWIIADAAKWAAGNVVE